MKGLCLTIRQLRHRVTDSAALLLSIMIALSSLSSAQLMIPVDKNIPAPNGFDFHGTWKCNSTSGSAMLRVGSDERSHWHRSWRNRQGGVRWTKLTEKDSGFAGHYLVAFDRDKKQFVIIDADDPAYVAYDTDGWHDQRLTLTSASNHAGSPQDYRYSYEILSAKEFTVTMESRDPGNSTTLSHATCEKRDRNSR